MLICQLAVLCSAWRSQLAKLRILIRSDKLRFIVEVMEINFSHKCFFVQLSFYLAGR